MIINSLKLKNIRSYVKEELIFPRGSVMLSGDIGSGKTTILLSIEFALFGIIRGQLSGSNLLRHGTNEGFVELNFTIDEKNVTVKRFLKRKNKTIAQDSGSIIVNDEQFDLTPVELKSKILELIGYPDELLTKSKSLIFRYTVYTPQEDMKQILLESQDERLDVIRRIFNIDKYKRIKENNVNYIRQLKIKKTELETRVEDLEEKKTEYKTYDDKIKIIKEESSKIQIIVNNIGKEVNVSEEEMKSFENQVKMVETLKNQVEIKTNNIHNKQSTIERNDESLKRIDDKIENLNKEMVDFKAYNIKELKLQRTTLEEEKSKTSDNIGQISDRSATFTAKKQNSEEIMKSIDSLDVCIVCKQKVDSNHKKHVNAQENEKILALEEQLLKLQELKSKRKIALEELNSKLSKINELLQKQEVMLLKKENLEGHMKTKEELIKEQTKLEVAIEKETAEMLEVKKNLEAQHDVGDKYQKAKTTLNNLREKLKVEEIKKAEFAREQRTLEEVKTRLKEEITRKEESKKQLAYIRQLQEWMVKFFMNVVYLMEKQIMLTIYQEFNEFFQEWFNMLIEDENLNVRLDETFTPIIEQNGYDTTILNLSGGERTSVALAYRLSLNKVINDFMGLIKTKDLLILDEPTDGFSSEQLDKIREVLEMINIKQIILVSHEPKLESYVDHIVRVNKEEHVSHILA